MKRYLLSLIAITSLTAANAQVFLATQEFSTSSNPNGVWSYGYSGTFGSFTAFSATGVNWNTGINEYWHRPLTGQEFAPVIFRNTSGIDYDDGGGNTLPANALGAHPGNFGSDGLVILRFVAPATGDYDVSVSYSAANYAGPTTTGVNVLINGISAYEEVINSWPSTKSYSSSSPIPLQLGETIDFVVGNGGNGFNSDMTAISAVITAVPEPQSIAVVGVGLVIFGVISRFHFSRRRGV